MSRHDARLAYQHMLENARRAKTLVTGKARQDLDTDWVITLALVRLLEIIGEAANRVPQKDRDRHPEIPWSQLVGLRNRLIHGYDAIDMDILWQILAQDLDPLIDSLTEMGPFI